MLHFSKWVHSRCSLVSFSKFRTLSCSHSGAISLLLLEITLRLPPRTPPACIPQLFNLVLFANAALPPHPRLQTSYPPSAHFVSSPSSPSLPPLAPGCLYISCFLFPLTPSGFFNGILAVSKPGALNCYFLSSHPVNCICNQRSNLNSSFLSGSLDSLLCNLIASIPCLAFSLVMLRTLATASSFSSGRAYPFLNFLPPLFLRLTPTLMM